MNIHSLKDLRKSLNLWKRREKRYKSKKNKKKARSIISRRRRQINHLLKTRRGRPKIITARSIDLHFQNLFGQLGPEYHVTGHHTAGPTDKSDSHAIQLCRQYHRDHKTKGWGGIGYHYCITRRGTIIGLRPVILKGAHVGNHNSNNVGIMFHGTTGDKPTKAQMKTYRWLLSHSNTKHLPKAHRTDRKINKPHADRRGHHDWPGHEWNACPGTHERMILSGGRKR